MAIAANDAKQIARHTTVHEKLRLRGTDISVAINLSFSETVHNKDAESLDSLGFSSKWRENGLRACFLAICRSNKGKSRYK
jgi:hypothetical protein